MSPGVVLLPSKVSGGLKFIRFLAKHIVVVENFKILNYMDTIALFKRLNQRGLVLTTQV